MLSTTTTALSTSMPTASSRPIIVRMLRVTPAKYMKPSVITKQIGIARVTISVDGQCRRKKNSTITDRRSEEYTSELQSLMRISYAVFCLKKKKNTTNSNNKKKT